MMPGKLVHVLNHLTSGSTSRKRWYGKVEGLLDQSCWLVLIKQEPKAAGCPSPPSLPLATFWQRWDNFLVREKYRLWRMSCCPASVEWDAKVWCDLMLEKSEDVFTVGDTALLYELQGEAGLIRSARSAAHRHM